MTEPQQSLRDKIKSLKEVANQQATAHAWLRDYYNRWNVILTCAALIPTAALLLFPLTGDDIVKDTLHMIPDTFKLLNAGVALFAFIAVLIQMVWRPDSLSKAHRHAVGHYTDQKFAARRLLENEQIDPTDAKVLEEKYLNVQGLPPIPEKRFLRLKQWHRQKLALSKEIDRDPWYSLFRLPWQKPKLSARAGVPADAGERAAIADQERSGGPAQEGLSP